MATAPASKTDGIPPASGTPIRVITPDQDGHFQLKIAKGDVAKIQIVDVDMVLVLKDGTRMVLAGGALGAMDADVRVQFSNGPDTAARLLEQVGKIELQKFDHPQVLNSEPIHPGMAEDERNGTRDMETAHDLASQAQAANATLAAISQALAQLANVVQQNAQPVNEFTSNLQGDVPKQPLVRHTAELPPERPGKTPHETVIGPDAPAMEIHLVNLTGTRQVGSALYGSGGSSELNSSVNTSNAAQFAPHIIHAGNDVRTIYATGKAPAAGNTPDGTFVKVLDVQISGDGKVQSLVISGVPADMSIVGATALGGGAYAISVSPDTKDYPIQIQYNTVAANPGAPIHADFKLTFSLAVITTEGVQSLTSVKQVVLKDVSSESDLSYANPVTGESVFVLPAQGISHIVHAGDNAGVTIYGSNANDFLYGGSGNDTLYGGFGNTYFEGGAGNDTIVGGLNAGGSNTNTVGYQTSSNGVTVDLHVGKALDGFGGTDTLVNIHSVIGSSGNDTFIVGAATKSVDGGAGGSDTLDFSHSGAAVTIDLKSGTGSGGYAQNLAFTHIDNVVGTSFDDTFIAGSTANRFDGGAGGSNTVSYAGSASGDNGKGVTVNLLTGQGQGADAEGDRYVGIQNVIGSAYDDVFVGNGDINYFDGGNGNDTVSYAGSAVGVTVDFYNGRGFDGNAEGDTYRNIENAIGSAYDDRFVVDTSTSRHFDGGSGGFDTVSYERSLSGVTIDAARNVGGLVTGTGAGGLPGYSNSYTNIDRFVGSNYADLFIASSRADHFDGLDGNDTVSYAADTAGVTIDLVDGTGTGGLAQGDTLVNIENIIGGSGNDTFVANDRANVFDGGSGGSNTVDYSKSTTGGVIVDLFHGDGVGTSGGFAQGDKFVNIQNAIGTAYDDVFVASADANRFDGGIGGRDRVSYANDTAGVTVDLDANTGTGGLAQGDTYAHIQDVTGGAGNDTFIASSEANHFDGGAGSNTVSYARSLDGVTVDLFAGTGAGGHAAGDTFVKVQNVIGSTKDDLFYASSEANSFTGNGGNDTVSYERANDNIGVTVDLAAGHGSHGFAEGDSYNGIRNAIGTAYDDTFIANNAANRFDGLDGNDTVSYAADTAGVTIDLVDGTGTGGLAQGDTLVNIENIIGGSGNDTFVANDKANVFDGGSGGSNTVDYSKSTTGGVIVDLFHGDGVGTSGGFAQGDKFINIQNVTGTAYDDVFVASTDANRFDGGIGGRDRVSYANDTAGVTVDLDANTGTGGLAQGDTYRNIQDVTGGSGDDTFIASSEANHFDGGAGSNTVSYAKSDDGVTVDLFAGTGAGGHAAGDTFVKVQNVIGSTKNDLFYASSEANSFTGNGGNDTVSYERANDGEGVTVDLSTGHGSHGFAEDDSYDGIRNAIGTAYDDTFIANDAANRFDGGSGGRDRVSYVNDTAGVTVDLNTNTGAGGLAAGDTYVNIQDVTGGAGDDTFVANAANNDFVGGAGVNTVSYAAAGNGVGVFVDLRNRVGGATGSWAEGDTYTQIQNVVGTAYNDTFVASDEANRFDGGDGSDTVSYAGTADAVTVNFTDREMGGVASMQGGGGAQGDEYVSIENVIGGSGDDLFYASADTTAAANRFDGGGGTHNRVSYEASTVGVTINLATGEGSAGAAGDTYVNIQDVTGGSGNDLFIASAAANQFDGRGHGTVSWSGDIEEGGDTVSYVSSTNGVVVNLATGEGGGSAGSWSSGDRYTGIENVIGSGYDDTLTGAASGKTILRGGAGKDALIGVEDNRANTYASYAGSNAGVTIDLVTGTGSGGHAQGDTLTFVDNVIGSDYSDTFVANAQANILHGGTGGSDTVSYAKSEGSVRVNLAATTEEGIAAYSGKDSYAEGDKYAHIQNAIGSAYDDVLIGATNGRTELRGGAGADTLIGIASNRANTYASYAESNSGVTIDLVTGKGSGGHAQGDTLTLINNLIGSSYNDLFIANDVANNFTGGGGNDTVSYQYSSSGVNVNLSTVSVFVSELGVTINSQTGNAGYAAGDRYSEIRNVIGSDHNDLFVASSAANHFDGGLGSNTVSYAANGTAVVVNLSGAAAHGANAYSGSGGWAASDTYDNIQNVTGSSSGNDIFVASDAANRFNGNGGTSNTVSYLNTTGDVNASLATGIGGTGGADIDTYVNIHNLTGSAVNSHNTLIGNDSNNILIASGSTTINTLDGGAGSDILDGRLGGQNTLLGGLGADTFYVQANGSSLPNIVSIVGGGGITPTTYAANTFDTLKIFGLTSAEPILDMASFLNGKVSGINRIDVTGDDQSTKLLFTANDVQALVGVGGTLTVMLDNAVAKDTILTNGYVEAGQNYYAFYDSGTYQHEIARINVQYV